MSAGQNPEPEVRTTAAAYPEERSRRLWQHHGFDALPLLTA
jgi:hypothetical protein